MALSLLRPRDQPRTLAPMILGVGNIGSGVTGLLSLNDHVPGYTYAAAFMPLKWWWVSFICLGAIILLGPVSPKVALVTALIALGWWLIFADFVWQAHTSLVTPHGRHLVSLRGVWSSVWLAALHLLLTPYLRRDQGPLTRRRPRGG